MRVLFAAMNGPCLFPWGLAQTTHHGQLIGTAPNINIGLAHFASLSAILERGRSQISCVVQCILS